MQNDGSAEPLSCWNHIVSAPRAGAECFKKQGVWDMYPILEAKKLADKIYLMVVKAPRISANCKPGEFVIVKMDEKGERIPLTICDYDREKETITIVFQTVGASTERMSSLQAGDSFRDVVGPLGNPSDFVKEDIEELKKKKYLFVAGGVGTAPV